MSKILEAPQGLIPLQPLKLLEGTKLQVVSDGNFMGNKWRNKDF